MSIVISTIFLLLLIFPGLIFRYLLIQGRNKKIRISNIEQVYWAVIPAFVLHVLVLGIILSTERFPNSDFNLLNSIVHGKFNFTSFQIAYSGKWFLFYYFSTSFLGAIFGVCLRKLFIASKADLVHPIFEVDDKWIRLFTADYIFRNFDVPREKLEISIDVLMIGDENKHLIYSGTLSEYYVDDRGELQNITLIDVFRRNLNEDRKNVDIEGDELSQNIDERYYQLPGHQFVIDMTKVLNMNVTYMEVSFGEGK